MKLAQKNDLPSFPLYRRFQDSEHRLSRKPSTKPSLTEPSAERKRNRRTDAVAGEHDGKPPPQSKEKAAAHAQDAAGQK
jgi:hypothetical protein